ncbi:hypothetical protein [Aurantiacibacter xanthus]|nr:hypothetical protein [Aurantiacibacter xanthus]
MFGAAAIGIGFARRRRKAS